MKRFINTGFHLETLTTVDDPSLEVVEQDDGHSWSMKFYAGKTLIDSTSLESAHQSDLDAMDENVKTLPVYCWYDNRHVGTVESVYKAAIVTRNELMQVTKDYINSITDRELASHETNEHLEQS